MATAGSSTVLAAVVPAAGAAPGPFNVKGGTEGGRAGSERLPPAAPRRRSVDANAGGLGPRMARGSGQPHMAGHPQARLLPELCVAGAGLAGSWHFRTPRRKLEENSSAA